MKKFTIIFSILLVLAFAGAMIWVASAPDFTEPASMAGEGEDPDAPVWSKTIEDLLAYLDEKGLVDQNDTGLLSDGIATRAIRCSGAEFYWWDLENLDRDSPEFTAYQEMMNDGMIDLWGAGQYYMSVTKNGPFGLSASGYEGDVKALLAAYAEFGH